MAIDRRTRTKPVTGIFPGSRIPRASAPDDTTRARWRATRPVVTFASDRRPRPRGRERRRPRGDVSLDVFRPASRRARLTKFHTRPRPESARGGNARTRTGCSPSTTERAGGDRSAAASERSASGERAERSRGRARGRARRRASWRRSPRPRRCTRRCTTAGRRTSRWTRRS